MLGVPVHPGAQFLASYDAGQGQRYYLFGSAATFADLVAYYRNVLKQRGELVFDEPATHMFEVGRFREETMAFPAGRDHQGLHVGQPGGLSEPEARRAARALPHDHSDRAGRRERSIGFTQG